MDYLATFYTHYGALQFNKHCKQEEIPAKMAPVPRELSASCGVCVCFETASAPEAASHEDMERCYLVSANGKYSMV